MTDEELAMAYFKNDIFAVETTGVHLEKVSEGYAKVSLPLSRAVENAAGRVIGGAIFTMADFAFAVAANYSRPVTVTLTSQVSYFCTASGDILYAETRCIRDGKHTCFYETDITDGAGTLIARVSTTGCRLKKRFKENEEAGIFSGDPYREQKA